MQSRANESKSNNFKRQQTVKVKSKLKTKKLNQCQSQDTDKREHILMQSRASEESKSYLYLACNACF